METYPVTRIVCRKNGKFLIPADENAIAVVEKLKDGRDVLIDVSAPRNIRHHRLFFAICKFIKEHCELFGDATIEEIKDSLKLATGLVKRHIDTDTGRTYFVLRSISWAAMDQTEFNKFFDAACQVISHRWMPPGVTPESVRDELILLCDGPHAIGERR